MEVETKTEEINMLKRISEKANQPYSFLVNGIEKTEKELYLANRNIKEKE